MKPSRSILGMALGLTAALAHAGSPDPGTVSVTASGGSVAGSGSSGGYAGLQGTAGTSTIQYGNDPGNSQLKFSNGGAGTNSLSGSTTNGGTTTNTTGQSSITNAPGAPTYYTAQWTSTATNPNGAPQGSGTYDPWTVTRGDLHAAGVYSGADTESLFYQADLLGGNFSVPQGQEGAYEFTVGESGLTFLDLSVYSDKAPTFTFNAYGGYSVYLLNPKLTYGAEETIPYRIANGTLLTPTGGAATINDFLNRYLQKSTANGTTSYSGSLGGYSLDLAIVYSVRLPTYSDADKNVQVARWNTNTVNSTPEPAGFVALGLGAVALLRRRRR